MRYLFLSVWSLLLAASWAYSQSEIRPIQFGLTAAGLISPTAIPDANKEAVEGPVGFGVQANAWIGYHLKKNQRIRISIGYRQLAGYQWRETSVQEVITPNQVRTDFHSSNWQALSYLDLGLAWEYTLQKMPRWSIQSGIRFAVLTRAIGSEQGARWGQGIDLYPEGNPFNGLYEIPRNYTEQLYERKLDRASFSSVDYGVNLDVKYELMPMLDLTVGYYRGLNSMLKDSKHYANSLSIGLEATLF